MGLFPTTIAGLHLTDAAIQTIHQNGFFAEQSDYKFVGMLCDFCLAEFEYGKFDWVFRSRDDMHKLACESCIESAISHHLDWCENCTLMHIEDGLIDANDGNSDQYEPLGHRHCLGPIPVTDLRPD